MNSGLPSIAIRDLDIQARENDLVIASYGRGFYILDDYSALREIKPTFENKEDKIFPIKTGLMYIESHPIGWRKKGHFGDNFYVADNPKFGIAFTYFISESHKTKKQIRKEEEKKLFKENKDISYPSFDELRAEDNELEAYLLFTIKDKNGNLVKRLKAPISKGVHKVYWNYRYEGFSPVGVNAKDNNISQQGFGMPAMPGEYTVEMVKMIDEKVAGDVISQKFKVKSLYNQRQQSDPKLMAYYKEMGETARQFGKIEKRLSYQQKQIETIIIAIKANVNNQNDLLNEALAIEKSLDSLQILVRGDASLKKRYTSSPKSLKSRLYNSIYEVWNNSEGPTGTHKNDIAIVQKHNISIDHNLNENAKQIGRLNAKLEASKVPYTPGR
jgi:hypothetical protein